MNAYNLHGPVKLCMPFLAVNNNHHNNIMSKGFCVGQRVLTHEKLTSVRFNL